MKHSQNNLTQVRSAGASPVIEPRHAPGANSRGVDHGCQEAVRSNSETALKSPADADKAADSTCHEHAAQKPEAQCEIKQLPGCLPEGYTLDSMLTPEQFCTWQQVKPTWLARRPRLFGRLKESREMQRIHPRTYLAKKVKGFQSA